MCSKLTKNVQNCYCYFWAKPEQWYKFFIDKFEKILAWYSVSKHSLKLSFRDIDQCLKLFEKPGQCQVPPAEVHLGICQISLREKYPNMEFFLFRIFPHLD